MPRDNLCLACFTGSYPLELPDESLLGKHLLEAEILVPERALDVVGLAASPAGGAANFPCSQQPLI